MRIRVALGLLMLLTGCGKDCNVSVDRCDTEECVIVDASKLQAEGCTRREGAACTEEGGVGDDVLTAAYRAADQTCWIFPNSYLPEGFEPLEAADPCAEELAEAMMCR
ncbi:MAG: hypothetical protein ABW217_18100 [Polyangiaceae bacterium]